MFTRSSANAACGGLKPPTAGRLRRAKPSSPAQHHIKKLYLHRTPLRARGTRSFSNLLSIRDALNCTETGRLTGCPARVVSPSCPIFPPPHLTFVGFCAVLDRTRWHVSQFRHGDDQIPSGGSFRAVPQQHSIFDLRIARGVRYRKGPVRCVPRYADANLMYGSVHAVRQHDG